MQATLWSLLAALAAVGCEWSYRALPAPWSNAWHFVGFIIAQSFVGVCVYKIVNTPNTSLLAAFIVWSFAVVVARTCVTVFLLHDKVSNGTWAAVALLLCARITQAFWK